jgi:acetyltransferase-like isoleucine patch superfamily enzyme
MRTSEGDRGVQIQHAAKRGGKLAQYQELVVGSTSIWYLIKFELITLFITRIPGALGIVLRKFLYPTLFKKVGHGVVFGADVWFRHPGKIEIGAQSIIDDGVMLDAKGRENRGIVIGAGCYVGRGTVLSCKDGDITLGDGANLSTWCNVSSNSSIVIGKKTLMGPHSNIFATTHNFDDVTVPILDQGWSSVGVTVGDDCWLGSGVSVVDGVTIGSHTVVGSGSVVVKDLPEKVVAVGAPAKVVRERGKTEGAEPV